MSCLFCLSLMTNILRSLNFLSKGRVLPLQSLQSTLIQESTIASYFSCLFPSQLLQTQHQVTQPCAGGLGQMSPKPKHHLQFSWDVTSTPHSRCPSSHASYPADDNHKQKGKQCGPLPDAMCDLPIVGTHPMAPVFKKYNLWPSLLAVPDALYWPYNVGYSTASPGLLERGPFQRVHQSVPFGYLISPLLGLAKIISWTTLSDYLNGSVSDPSVPFSFLIRPCQKCPEGLLLLHCFHHHRNPTV